MRREDASASVFIAPFALEQAQWFCSHFSTPSESREQFIQWFVSQGNVTALWSWLDPQEKVPAELKLQALCHSSFINEYTQFQFKSYERLEFLGDAVIGILSAEMLYLLLPQAKEGELSQLRRALVSGECCLTLARLLNVQYCALTGRGEWSSIEKVQEWQAAPQADLFESVMGAIFLAGGLDAAKTAWQRCWELVAIKQNISPLEYARKHFIDAKSELQQLTLQRFKAIPEYVYSDQSSAQYTVEVLVQGHRIAQASGLSKRTAEQAAAQAAIQNFLNANTTL